MMLIIGEKMEPAKFSVSITLSLKKEIKTKHTHTNILNDKSREMFTPSSGVFCSRIDSFTHLRFSSISTENMVFIIKLDTAIGTNKTIRYLKNQDWFWNRVNEVSCFSSWAGVKFYIIL